MATLVRVFRRSRKSKFLADTRSPRAKLRKSRTFVSQCLRARVESSNSEARTSGSGFGEATRLGGGKFPDGTVGDNCSTLTPWNLGPTSRWVRAAPRWQHSFVFFVVHENRSFSLTPVAHERSSGRVEHLSLNVCVPGWNRRTARRGRVAVNLVRQRGLAAENCPTEQLGTTVLL
jgi:hypothetical protein